MEGLDFSYGSFSKASAVVEKKVDCFSCIDMEKKVCALIPAVGLAF